MQVDGQPPSPRLEGRGQALIQGLRVKRFRDENLSEGGRREGKGRNEDADLFVAPGSGLLSVVLQSTVSASTPSVWLHIHADLKSREGREMERSVCMCVCMCKYVCGDFPFRRPTEKPV